MNRCSSERMIPLKEQADTGRWRDGAAPAGAQGEKPDLPSEELLCDLAELFRIFGDSSRVKLLYALLGAEMCVGDLAESVGMTGSAVSHQLRVLKQSKLVKSRRAGKTIFYSLADDHVRTIIDMGMEHLCE